MATQNPIDRNEIDQERTDQIRQMLIDGNEEEVAHRFGDEALNTEEYRQAQADIELRRQRATEHREQLMEGMTEDERARREFAASLEPDAEQSLEDVERQAQVQEQLNQDRDAEQREQEREAEIERAEALETEEREQEQFSERSQEAPDASRGVDPAEATNREFRAASGARTRDQGTERDDRSRQFDSPARGSGSGSDRDRGSDSGRDDAGEDHSEPNSAEQVNREFRAAAERDRQRSREGVSL